MEPSNMFGRVEFLQKDSCCVLIFDSSDVACPVIIITVMMMVPLLQRPRSTQKTKKKKIKPVQKELCGSENGRC